VDLRTLIAHVGMATLQVGESGDEKQVAEAKKVLSEARKSLYRILGGGGVSERLEAHCVPCARLPATTSK
jgi:hypothetical protein